MAAMRESEQYYGARRHSLQGEKIQCCLLCHLWQDGLWYTIYIRGWQGGKGEFVLGDICLVRGGKCVILIE